MRAIDYFLLKTANGEIAIMVRDGMVPEALIKDGRDQLGEVDIGEPLPFTELLDYCIDICDLSEDEYFEMWEDITWNNRLSKGMFLERVEHGILLSISNRGRI